MSARQEFITAIAQTLNKMAEEFTDVTATAVARKFCGRNNVGEGMPREIADNHNEVIRIAHVMASRLDWMPTTKVYFIERLYSLEDINEDDIIRSVCLGGGKPCFGFRLARGDHDLFYARWTGHYHAVRSGVQKAADVKTLRAASNARLPHLVATKMITTAETRGLNCTDYPAWFHYHKNDPSGALVKSNWTSPTTTLWSGDKNAVALFAPGLDRQRVNILSFEVEMRYLVEKKYRGIDPKQTIAVARSVYSQVIYAIFQKSPGKRELTKPELDVAAKEIDVFAIIHKEMAAYQKPPTNLLE